MRTDPGHVWVVSWGCPGTTSPPPDLHIPRIAPGSGAGDVPLLRSAAATWAQGCAGAGAGSNRARAPIPSHPPDEVTVGRSGWRRRTGGIRSLGRFPRTDRRPRDPILGRGGFRTPRFAPVRRHVLRTCTSTTREPGNSSEGSIHRLPVHETATTNAPLFQRRVPRRGAFEGSQAIVDRPRWKTTFPQLAWNGRDRVEEGKATKS